MKRYSFLLDYEGGTYIKQSVAADLSAGIHAYGIALAGDVEVPSYKSLSKAIERKLLKGEMPAPITGMVGVWCLSFLCRQKLGLLNIVEAPVCSARASRQATKKK